MAESEGSVAKKIQDKRAKVELHMQKDKERADKIQLVRAAYQDPKVQFVLDDIMEKASQFMGYHNKVAQDGVGSKATGDFYENGNPVMEVVSLNPNERVSHLDKSAGIQELFDYVTRNRTVKLPPPNAAKTAETEAAQAQAESDAPNTEEEVEATE